MPDRFVTPQAFQLGEPAIYGPGLNAYIRHVYRDDPQGIDKVARFFQLLDQARADGLSDGEILCSIYSKICYKSFLPDGRNANITQTRDIWDNLVNCFDTGHGSVFEHVMLNLVVSDCSRVLCFAENTELLTRSGWKSVANITTQDSLLTKNPLTGRDEWANPLKVHSFRYEGRMLGWGTSQGSSPAVTADHLLWAAPYDLRRYRGMPCDEIVTHAEKTPASELFGKRIVVDNVITMAAPNDPEEITLGEHTYDAYSLFCWLGWMATDGGFSKDRPNQCAITQTKTGNWPELEDLMTSLFGDRWRSHGPYELDSGTTSRLFVISDTDLAKWAREMIGRSKMARDLSPLFVFSSRLLRGFVQCAIRGDGNVHAENGHEVLYCPTKELAGQYQILVSMIGQCAMVRSDDRVGESHDVNGVAVAQRQPSYVVSISRKRASLILRRHWQEYQADGEMVYCPQTTNGLVFARCGGGMPAWTGNTHELVRHRIGVAFSQTSGRYCRLDFIPLVWDPVLDPVKDLWEEHMLRTEDVVYLSECRLGLRVPPPEHPDRPEAVWSAEGDRMLLPESKCWVPNDAMPFSQKKKLTSAIRRIAPNGQANEIGVSLNLRALRHTMLMRTARVAEWEIRSVFAGIYQMLKSRYPLLFHGATETLVDDVIEVSGLKMQPYDKPAAMVLEEMSDDELVLYLRTRPKPVCDAFQELSREAMAQKSQASNIELAS